MATLRSGCDVDATRRPGLEGEGTVCPRSLVIFLCFIRCFCLCLFLSFSLTCSLSLSLCLCLHFLSSPFLCLSSILLPMFSLSLLSFRSLSLLSLFQSHQHSLSVSFSVILSLLPSLSFLSLYAVRRTQPQTIGLNFFNPPPPTIETCNGGHMVNIND